MIDPSEFRAAQRGVWDANAAGWRKWWRVFESGAQVVNERLVEMAGVREGHRVLDVASGTGEPALTAARRVGPSGRVLATDLSPGMLEVARERAREKGLSNVDVCVADAESLDAEAGSFDAALCRWGLMLMLDPVAAARAVHRALKPGGRFAAAVWGTAEEAPFIAIPLEVATRVGGVPPPKEGEPGALALGARGRLESVLERGGFREIDVEDVQVAFEFASPDEFVAFRRDIPGALEKALAERPEEVRARVWAELEKEIGLRAGPDGRIRLRNVVRCARGVR